MGVGIYCVQISWLWLLYLSKDLNFAYPLPTLRGLVGVGVYCVQISQLWLLCLSKDLLLCPPLAYPEGFSGRWHLLCSNFTALAALPI